MTSILVCDICGETIDRADLIVVRLEDNRALRRMADLLKARVHPPTTTSYDRHYDLHTRCFEAQILPALPPR